MDKVFKINREEAIECDWKDTRNGFKHVCTFKRDYEEIEKVSVNYLNRTWESYEYETAIKKLLNKMDFDEDEREYILDITSGRTKRNTYD